jgi:hypothetical protein
MLDDIRFAIPAVAKKAYVEDLTHFRIKGGRITGFDGRITLSSPIGVDLDVRPNAAKFLAAVRACEGAIGLHVTPAGKLAVRAGKFKVFVDCLADDGAFESQPEGDTIELGESFLVGLRSLSPAIGIDASRPWAMGIKVSGQSMFATNNVIFAQFWHGTEFPFDIVIPGRAIEEMLRIGTAPTKVQVCPNSITFWFSEDRWLKTTLLEGDKWPLDKIAGLMDATEIGDQLAFPEGFFDSLEKLKPFLAEDHGIYIRPNLVSTGRDEGEGGSFEVSLEGIPELQCYSFQQLQVLGEIATAINWKTYPKPCMFTHGGQPLRGLILGRHL